MAKHSIHSKKPYLLLEVIIAFALVVIALIPLLQPHWHMARLELQVQAEIAAERLARQLYVDVLERLHRNEIPWSKITSGQIIEASGYLVESLEQQQYRAQWYFSRLKFKEGDISQYVMKLNIQLVPLGSVSAKEYTYPIFMTHQEEG